MAVIACVMPQNIGKIDIQCIDAVVIIRQHIHVHQDGAIIQDQVHQRNVIEPPQDKCRCKSTFFLNFTKSQYNVIIN